MMHPNGDNNWLHENVDYGSSSAVAKSNYRQALQYNDYIMQNRNQCSLKNEPYSNYYNRFMPTQNNTAYNNNYSDYSNYSNCNYNNQQGMQASQPVWGPRHTSYCLAPSCPNHSNPSNAVPTKPMQYSHSSYERAPASHNMGRHENPVMDSLSHMSNYNPYLNQQSHYENPHLNNSKIVQNNKRYVSESSKIQVRNVFQLNNSVCNQTDTNIPQRSNKSGHMNRFLNSLPGQNQNQIIPPIKQHENICSAHGNCNHMKPDQYEGRKSVTNLPVTKTCQNMPTVNSVNMNRNNGYCYQNNGSNNLNLPQQYNHNSNLVENHGRERNTFPENIDVESAFRKNLSCMQEAADSEKQKKALAFAIEQAKARESNMTNTGIPKKSPSGQKNVKDLTDGRIEESVFFTKKSKTLRKALLGKKTLMQELQNGSNSQRVDDAEEYTPEVITIKEEKEDWVSENSYTVETCVIENENINKNKDEDLYVIKSKFENKINKDKLTSLMGLLSRESFTNKRNTSAEKDSSSTVESVQFENNNNKRIFDDNILNHDSKKLTKKSSNGMLSLALSKTTEAEDIESLKSIVLKECGLEPELDFRLLSNTFEDNESSSKDGKKDEEEDSRNIDTNRNSKVVEKESNSSSPKEAIVKEVVETNIKKRRPSEQSSTDSVDGTRHGKAENVGKVETKDVGVQIALEPGLCPSCLAKSNETNPEEVEGIISTMRAFQTLRHHKCMSCDLTVPSNTFWVNVVSGELRCLHCFKKMVKKPDEGMK